MFGRKKIKELEKRVEALEMRIESMFKLDKPSEQSSLGDKESETVTVAQVLDDWINGKKEGGK